MGVLRQCQLRLRSATTAAPTGSGNYQQGSPSFGDIRIGGYAQASNILAYTLLPPPSNGGSDSGDIFLNSSIAWNIDSNYDLESVALHEIGHALGLAHSTDVNAVMYPYYNGVQQSPDTDDVNGVQSIWGPRQEDGLAVGNSNFTSAKAADITRFTNGANDQIVLPNQDVASSAESYWFKVTTPANASHNFTVQIQSSSLSELSPKVQLYNSSLKGWSRSRRHRTRTGRRSTPRSATRRRTRPTTSACWARTEVPRRRRLCDDREHGSPTTSATTSAGTSAISLVAPRTRGPRPARPGGRGIYDTNGAPGWTWWNGFWNWIPASIHSLEARGDFLLISPGTSTPNNSTVAGGSNQESAFHGLDVLDLERRLTTRNRPLGDRPDPPQLQRSFGEHDVRQPAHGPDRHPTPDLLLERLELIGSSSGLADEVHLKKAGRVSRPASSCAPSRGFALGSPPSSPYPPSRPVSSASRLALPSLIHRTLVLQPQEFHIWVPGLPRLGVRLPGHLVPPHMVVHQRDRPRQLQLRLLERRPEQPHRPVQRQLRRFFLSRFRASITNKCASPTSVIWWCQPTHDLVSYWVIPR